MTDRRDAADDLARLVREAADQVQPRPALDAIRSRTVTAPKESAMSIARTWVLGGLGGAVATAAVIGGVYLASSNGGHDEPIKPGPATQQTQSATPTPSESASGSASGGEQVTVPVYYLGATPGGSGLYREFRRTTIPEGGGLDEKVGAALTTALRVPPLDPDYSTPWPAGTAPAVTTTTDQITVNLESADVADVGLHDRPTGMSAREADLAIQQLIYTAQAAYGQGRMPVQLLLDGQHSDTILGVPTAEPLANAPVLETLSHVNISTPSEGDEVMGDSLQVTGVASSYEANVVVKLQRYEGTYVAFQEPVTAEGWMGDKLFPFSGSFDISKVEPGKYALTATTDDPSGGAEGPGAYTDSKVITIK